MVRELQSLENEWDAKSRIRWATETRIRWPLKAFVVVEYVTREYGAAKCNFEITSGVAII